MRKQREISSGEIGLTCNALGVIFIILKLTGVINWSWWYVTLPFWGGGLLVLLIIAVFIFINWIEQIK